MCEIEKNRLISVMVEMSGETIPSEIWPIVGEIQKLLSRYQAVIRSVSTWQEDDDDDEIEIPLFGDSESGDWFRKE